MTVFGRGYRKRLWALAGAACTLSLVLGCGAAGLTLGAAAAQASVTPGFDDQASLFKIFYDCHPVQNPCPGHAQVADVPSPSEDGNALKISYASGNPAYMGADAYIRLGTDDAATRYQVDYDFYLPSRAPVQARPRPATAVPGGGRARTLNLPPARSVGVNGGGAPGIRPAG
jgi:hypothetical protein